MILIVEDVEMIASHIGDICDQLGVGFSIAGLGRDALAIASTRRLRLAIVDLRLPDMSGVDLIKQIRELPEPYGDVPILAASGESRRVIIQALRAGANGMIEKPYGLDALKVKIVETIRS